jgi:pyruvate formate lyase activating enzyme
MRIGGFHPFSLTDYPGSVAAIVFTQGCNFRCQGCHNQQLIPFVPTASPLIDEQAVLDHLARRSGQLDGVVVSGGEPTMQENLPDFLMQLKSLGYALKLDTNGSHPRMLRLLVSHGLLDHIAMDVKAPWEIYPQITGVDFPIALLQESMQIVAESGITHEFRTTRNPALSDMHLLAIRAMLPKHSPHRIQLYHFAVAPMPARQTNEHDRVSPDSACRPATSPDGFIFTPS